MLSWGRGQCSRPGCPLPRQSGVSPSGASAFQVKRIVEEAVTRKFVHEDSSHIISFCGESWPRVALKSGFLSVGCLGAVAAFFEQSSQRSCLGCFLTVRLFSRFQSDSIREFGSREKIREDVKNDICAGGSDGKASAYNAGDPGSIPGSGRSPGEGNGNPLQHSCLGNPMNGGTW